MPEESSSNLDKDSLYVVTSSTRIAILKLLIEKKHLTVTDISKKLNLSKSTVHEHLEKLVATGLITKSEISGKKWIYYKPTWRGYSLFPKKDRMQINIVIPLILVVAVSVVLATIFYVWAAGLATTGGTTPPAFSAKLEDYTGDNVSTYYAGPMKLLAKVVGGGTNVSGSTVAARPYNTGNGSATKAFAVMYTGTSTLQGSGGPVVVTVKYKDQDNADSTTTATFATSWDTQVGIKSGHTIVADLESGDKGVKSVVSATIGPYQTNGWTWGTNNTFEIYTAGYDTIGMISVTSGTLGKITDLTFSIKVGTGEWQELVPDITYKIGSVVLSGTDTNWDGSDVVYISEPLSSTTEEIVGASTTSQVVYVKIFHKPSNSKIFEQSVSVL
jgi:DNA-binding transcriptional ArsR family regulator